MTIEGGLAAERSSGMVGVEWQAVGAAQGRKGTGAQGQGRTGQRASEMESYGVSVSAREMQGRGSCLSISLALTQTP